jgi:flagellar M-ring protein FliF
VDFFNQAYGQLTELFRSMSAGTRAATALLLVLVVVSVVYLVQYQVVGGDEYLLGGRPFTQSEVTAIEAAFAKAGLGKSQVVGSQIRIPRGQKDAYLAALADASALPADFHTYLDEAIAADSPFSSSKSLEMRRWNARQKTLSLIIGRMRGIESATVQYDEETKRGLVPQKSKTAMVAVQTRGGQLDDDQLRAIRNVVASAYAGLERHQITITDMTSGFTYGGAVGPDGLPEEESIYASYKQRYEREWQRKIQQQLSYISGVIVGVNVELNPEVKHDSQSVKLDTKPVTVASKESTKESKNRTPQVQGRPGAQSNGVETPGNRSVAVSAPAGGPESETTESRTDTQNLPSHDTTVVQQAALIPKKATASIDVPASYFVAVWRRRNPPPAGKPPRDPDPGEIATIQTEEQNFIKEKVRNLLPDVDKGTNPYPHIVVSTYTDLPTAPPAEPTLAATAGSWLAENWQTLAVIAVGLASLLMLRGMVRAAPAISPAAAAALTGAAEQPGLAIHQPPAEEEAPEPVRILKGRFRDGGPDLKMELHEIVKENPDAAATILRSWIGEAA